MGYVAETELAGRGAQVTEYEIAVQALGRRAGFDRTADASVRNRAHLLRRKLEKYYAEENPAEHLRIELPKGRYCPVFRIVTPHAEPESKLPGELREAWGPLVAPGSNPLICIATPAHVMLRPDEVRIPTGDPGREAGEFLDWYRTIPSMPGAQRLFLRPSNTSPLWGDCAGALAVTKVLIRADAAPELLQELATSIPALRNRNVILFGRADYSKAVDLLTRDAPFQVRFCPEIRESAVMNLQPRNGEPAAYLPEFSRDNRSETVYGLITVIPSKSTNPGQQRTVIFSGTISPGAQAAAEFFCSTRDLGEFRRLLEREGNPGFPDAYQVVVKAQVHGTMVLEVSYVTHRVLVGMGC